MYFILPIISSITNLLNKILKDREVNFSIFTPQVMNDLAESQLKYNRLKLCISPLYRGNGTKAMIVTQLVGSLIVR